jgi:hypothetical protein
MNRLRKIAGRFPLAVLTYVDGSGYPSSIRCRLNLDGKSFRVEPDPGGLIGKETAKASLLFHSHEENLWRLRTFMVRGRLEPGGRFIASKVIAGVSSINIFIAVGNFWRSRATVRSYLRSRDLLRPKIPWKEISRLKKEAKEIIDSYE